MAPLEYSENIPAVLPVSPALPADTLLARYAFSQALSRSTALSALEESLEDYLSSVALLPHSLEKTGRPGLSREALIKKLGVLMKFRQGLNLNRENFSDTPDLYWTEPELEGWVLNSQRHLRRSQLVFKTRFLQIDDSRSRGES